MGLLCRPPARGLGCGLPHCPVRLGDRRTEGKGGGGGVPPLLQLETSSPLRGSWQWEREPGKEKNLEFPLLFSKHHKTPFCVWSQNPSVGAGAGGRAGGLCAPPAWCPHSSVLPTAVSSSASGSHLTCLRGFRARPAGQKGCGLPAPGREARVTAAQPAPADGTCVGLFRKPRPKSWATAGEPHAAPSRAALRRRRAPRT